MDARHIEAAASQAGTTYDEALALIQADVPIRTMNYLRASMARHGLVVSRPRKYPFDDAKIADILNRRVAVENVLAEVAAGKRPLLTREECRDLARKLGVPE